MNDDQFYMLFMSMLILCVVTIAVYVGVAMQPTQPVERKPQCHIWELDEAGNIIQVNLSDRREYIDTVDLLGLETRIGDCHD